MNSLHLGISFSNQELAVAWKSASNDGRLESVCVRHQAPDCVQVVPQPTALLPVQFVGGRALEAGHTSWLRAFLPHLRLTLQATLNHEEPAAICLSVPASVNRDDRDQLREAIISCGWPAPRIVGHDYALLFDRMRHAEQPITAVACVIEFDGIDLSVLNALKGRIRPRDRMRLDCLSTSLLDESIVAACCASGAEEDPIAIDWMRRWEEASLLRQELETGSVAALQLSADVWGSRRTIDLSREDLLPQIEPDFLQFRAALNSLLERNQVGQDELQIILLSGTAPAPWPALPKMLFPADATKVEYIPWYRAAYGAALLAAVQEPTNSAFVDLPTSGEAPPTSSSARARPLDSSLRTQALLTTPGPERNFPSSKPNEDDFQELTRRLWSYIRGVQSVSLELAKAHLEEIVHIGREMLEEQAYQAEPLLPESAINHDIERARQSLREHRPQEAIQISHLAQSRNPDDPEVFRQMINIHIEAAEQTASDEEAAQWLECAHAHDPSDHAIHLLMAQRYYSHAVSSFDAGKLSAALKAIQRSLDFAPDDPAAIEVADRITALLHR